MKTKLLFCAALFLAAAFFMGCVAPPEEKASEPAAAAAVAANEPVIGKLAPDFTLTDLNGEDIRLSSLKGNFVILEWINYDCPFVRKHYSTGNMQKLQNDYMEKGAIWLGICSSAPGKQGYFSPEEWKKLSSERNSSPTHILLDPSGKVGKLYRAKTTPEMFIINPDGVLIYMGAIDDNPSRRAEDVKTAENYVRSAMDAALAGEKVEKTVTRPYGCSVKYAD